jgi:hypothetical protein
VASDAVRRVIRGKGLAAVMADTAVLAGIDIRHLHFSRALFHPEYLGMAIQAFEPGIDVNLAVKGNLSIGGIPLGCFS